MEKQAKADVPSSPATLTSGILHAQAAIGRLLGNKRQYYELLRAFREQHARAVEQVAAAIAGGDLVSGVRLLHALRGTAAMIGGLELTEVAGAAELLLQRPEHTSHQALLDGLAAALQATLLAIEHELARGEASPAGVNRGPAD